MRAKNEAKFLREAYTTVNNGIILERVVDGTLMCPEACCGAPVMECSCGPDCPHCNCFMIQEAVKKNGLEDKRLKIPEEDNEATSASFGRKNKKGYDGPWKNPDRERPDSGDAAMEFDRRGFAKNTKAGKEDNEEPKRGISGYEHKPDALVSARKAGAIHKPYVSSFVSDGGKIFGVMGSDGKIVHKTRDKQKAYKWFRDNYDNI